MSTSYLESTPDESQRQPRAWAALLALMSANAVSLIGNTLTQVAIPWFVLETTGSAAQTGLTAFVGMVPLVLGAFFGGSVVDRIGYKRASVISDLLSGVTVALIPILYLTVGLQFWQLLALVFLGGLLDVPGSSARQALIPDIARRAGVRLERINAAYATIERSSLLVGPPLAGVLIAVLGASNVLLIDAATFAVSALLIGLIVPAAKAAAPSAKRYLADVLEGLRFIRQSRLLWVLMLTATLSNAFATPIFAVILPYFINRTYGDATGLGLLIAAFGGSSVAGVLAYGAIGHRFPRRMILILGFGGMGIATTLLALLPPFPLLLAAMMLAGLLSGPLNPMIQTVLQERTPAGMLARVFGTVVALALMASPLSVLLAGYLVEIIGVQWCLVGLAVGSLLLALSLALNPAVREIDVVVPRPAESAAES